MTGGTPGPEVRVLFETDDYLAVDKPEGVVSARRGRQGRPPGAPQGPPSRQALSRPSPRPRRERRHRLRQERRGPPPPQRRVRSPRGRQDLPRPRRRHDGREPRPDQRPDPRVRLRPHGRRREARQAVVDRVEDRRAARRRDPAPRQPVDRPAPPDPRPSLPHRPSHPRRPPLRRPRPPGARAPPHAPRPGHRIRPALRRARHRRGAAAPVLRGSRRRAEASRGPEQRGPHERLRHHRHRRRRSRHFGRPPRRPARGQGLHDQPRGRARRRLRPDRHPAQQDPEQRRPLPGEPQEGQALRRPGRRERQGRLQDHPRQPPQDDDVRARRPGDAPPQERHRHADRHGLVQGPARDRGPASRRHDDASSTRPGRSSPRARGPSPCPTCPSTERSSSPPTSSRPWTPSPARLLIVGAGVIGCELAFIFRSLGSEVVIVEKADRALLGLDHDVAALITRELKKRGIRLVLGAGLERVEGIAGLRRRRPARAVLEGGETIELDRIIVGIGRLPNTDGLGLAAAGIAPGPRGEIQVDDRMQTSVAGHLRRRRRPGPVHALVDGRRRGPGRGRERHGTRRPDGLQLRPLGHLHRPGGRLGRRDRGVGPGRRRGSRHRRVRLQRPRPLLPRRQRHRLLQAHLRRGDAPAHRRPHRRPGRFRDHPLRRAGDQDGRPGRGHQGHGLQPPDRIGRLRQGRRRRPRKSSSQRNPS